MQVKDPNAQERQHRALLAQECTDERVDANEQRELSQVLA